MSEQTWELPMFPLGSVLLPGMLLPLHVFEPRYRVLAERVLASDPPEFGVVLIERGSEVGGGEVRSDTGCVARVVQARSTPDGRWELIAVGTRRVEVREWLPDDPHPLARLVARPDRAGPAPSTGRLAELDEAVLHTARLAAAVGLAPFPEQLVLSEDPELHVYQLATVSPLGALDRQRILCAPDLVGRMDLLEELVADQRILLEARLDPGDDDPND